MCYRPTRHVISRSCRPSSTCIKYKVENVPGTVVSTLYQVRLLALQPLSAGNSTEFSQTGNSKTIHRMMKLISLYYFGSWESIYIYFKTIKLKKRELNHFDGDWNTIISLFRSLASNHKKARETKIHSCQHIGLD